MKKIALITFIVTGIAFNVKAQEQRGFYLKPSLSYFFKVTPGEYPNIGSLQPRDYVFSIDPSGIHTISEKTITGSFGQGTRMGLSGGFRFNQGLAVEMGINYFKSDKNTMVKQTGFIGNMQVLGLKSVGQVSAFDLTPSLVFHLATQSKFKPYLKVGSVVPISGSLEIDTEVNDQTGIIAQTINPAFVAVELKRTEKVKPLPTIGFLGAVGFNYPIGKKISLFGEIEYRNVSVGSKEKEIESFNAIGTLADGTKINVSLNDLPVAMIKTDYHETLTSSSNVAGTANYDPNRPSDDLKSYINIGGLGLSLGIRFDL